jgi:nucleoside-diphosphate-sugar epimerase
MKILITGNMGYVGPVVCGHLRSVFPQAHLTGYDSAWFAQCLTTYNPVPERALDQQDFGDVRDITEEYLTGFDAVVHLAAVSNDPMGGKFEQVTDEINHQASVNLGRMAASAGVKSFVFASSCSVYGFAEDGRARSETDPVNPLTAYARSKIDTEKGLLSLSNSGMAISCLRFATACGMSPRLRLDLVINDFVACALSSGEITVLSDGSPWRPLIHVRDMARAIEWALIRDTSVSGNYLCINVGSEDWNYQVRDLAEAVKDAVPGTKVSINTSAPPDKRSYKVDFEQFRRLAPDHQPQQTLATSIAGLRDGLNQLGFADKNFRQSYMIRLKMLECMLDEKMLTNDLRWQREGFDAVSANTAFGRLHN